MFKQSRILLLATCCLLTVAVCSTNGAPPRLVGGLQDEQAADDEVGRVVDSIRPEVERMSNTQYKSLKPLTYKKQVVAGANYFVKVLATANDGSQSHLHLRVYRPFSGPLQLTALRTNLDGSKPLEYFQ